MTVVLITRTTAAVAAEAVTPARHPEKNVLERANIRRDASEVSGSGLDDAGNIKDCSSSLVAEVEGGFRGWFGNVCTAFKGSSVVVSGTEVVSSDRSKFADKASNNSSATVSDTESVSGKGSNDVNELINASSEASGVVEAIVNTKLRSIKKYPYMEGKRVADQNDKAGKLK